MPAKNTALSVLATAATIATAAVVLASPASAAASRSASPSCAPSTSSSAVLTLDSTQTVAQQKKAVRKALATQTRKIVVLRIAALRVPDARAVQHRYTLKAKALNKSLATIGASLRAVTDADALTPLADSLNAVAVQTGTVTSALSCTALAYGGIYRPTPKATKRYTAAVTAALTAATTAGTDVTAARNLSSQTRQFGVKLVQFICGVVSAGCGEV